MITPIAGGIRLHIHVQPNARKNQVIGPHGKSLKIKIAAVPEDGKANAELCDFIASLLGIAKRDVSVVSGMTSRLKVVEVMGVTVDSAIAALFEG